MKARKEGTIKVPKRNKIPERRINTATTRNTKQHRGVMTHHRKSKAAVR